MSDSFATKSPADSRVEMTQIVLPGDTNALGTAFGGKVMQWIDIAAAVAARRHAGRTAVTASIDGLQLVAPIRQGDVVVLRAAVNRSWCTSMEVGVRVECEPGGDHENPVYAASAHLTFVAVDAEGKPTAVPALVPATDHDRRRYEAAGERRGRRLRDRDALLRKGRLAPLAGAD